jgi:nicotinamidase-related amidase
MGMTDADPHDCAAEKAETVLLLIDVINDFDFPQGGSLFRFALPAARRIATLKRRLRRRGVPAIYVNDNFGRWQSDFRAQVQRCTEETCRGAKIARLLLPAEDDYFVLKPKSSAFFSTTLEVLLRYFGAKTLIVTGFAADICVLFTVFDAHMRDFAVVVPTDCVASETTSAKRHACRQMERFANADLRASRLIRA